jgi:hypothetical protein
MLSPGGEVRQTLRNEAHCTIPYASRRLVKDGDLIVSITKEHKEAIRHGDFAHPDSDFVRDRFVWKNRQFPGLEALAAKADVEPLALWGSYDKEDYLSRFARELGVAQCQVVRLRPTAVCLAGVDSGKLRAALRNIDSSSRIPASTRSAETAPAPPKPAPKPVAASVSVASGGDGSTAIDDLFAKRLNVLRAKRETAQLEERVMCMATTTSAGNEDVHEDDNASGVFEYHHDHV